MLEEYRKHVANVPQGIAPKPLDQPSRRTCRLLKNPPAGEEDFLKDLFTSVFPWR
ncbi:hypothetical protein ACNKHX_00770 [Shigella flexneri]